MNTNNGQRPGIIGNLKAALLRKYENARDGENTPLFPIVSATLNDRGIHSWIKHKFSSPFGSAQ